jgi:hypothetical protein
MILNDGYHKDVMDTGLHQDVVDEDFRQMEDRPAGGGGSLIVWGLAAIVIVFIYLTYAFH